MKIGKGRGPKTSATAAVGRPTKNNSKRNLYILVTVLITALLIVWVYSMGRKPEHIQEPTYYGLHDSAI